MKEVEDAVAGEGDGDDPEILFESDDGEDDECGCDSEPTSTRPNKLGRGTRDIRLRIHFNPPSRGVLGVALWARIQ